MANAKMTALTELTTPDKDDLVYVVDDPAGSPISKKMKLLWVKGYRSWVGRIFQTGTDHPVVEVEYQDDFGITVTLTRGGAGVWALTSSSAVFTTEKTVVFFSIDNVSDTGDVVKWDHLTTSLFNILIQDNAGVGADDVRLQVEIRVYP